MNLIASRRVTAGAVALCLIFVAHAASAAPKAPKNLDASDKSPQVFRYKFKAGEVRSYATTMDQKVSMDAADAMPGMQTQSTIDAVMAMGTQKVKPDGSAVVETTYKDFKFKLSQNGVPVAEEQLKPLLAMLSDLKTETTITTRGEIKDFSGSDNPAMKQVTESMKSALAGSMPAFPAKGVKVGESWKQSVPMDVTQGPMKVKIDFVTRYTFLGYTKLGKVRVAVFRTEVEASIEGPKEVPNFTMKGSGKGNGFIYFDGGTGRLVRSELEINQNTTMQMSGPGVPAPQTITLKQLTSSSMSLKKGK